MATAARAPSARSSDRVFLRHSYTTNLGAGRAHVRYIAFRSREIPTDQRGVFSADQDSARVDPFTARLDSRLTHHPKVAKLHKLTLSFRQDQWDQAKFSSFKPIVREAIANFEQATGKKLDWVAAAHMAKGHPHCHIAIAGTYQDAAGQPHRLRLDMREVKAIREDVQRIYERDRHLHRAVEAELDREQQQLERPLLGRITGDLLRQVVQAAEREHRRHEMERQRERQR